MSGEALYAVWDGRGAPEDLSARLFAGDLVLLRGEDTVRAFAERARALVEQAFGSAHPPTAEASMETDVFRSLVAQARKSVAEDAELSRIWGEIQRGLGYEVDELFRDRIALRAAPSRAEARSRLTQPIPIHRDSWGSCIHAQINWWTPLYPLAPTRTMVMWPSMFRTPVANNSEDWDYDGLVEGRAKGLALLPSVRETPQEEPVPILIEPGELLLFSAAHLHGGVADASGVTRFSIDTRTVWARDVEAGRGAPNVDCARKPPRWRMFSPTPDAALGEQAERIENPAIGGVL